MSVTMLSKYEYKSSADFVSQIDYHYIKTYSFQRGDEHLLHQQNLLKEYKRLDRIVQAGGIINAEEEKSFEQLKTQVSKTQLLINEGGEFQSSAQLTHTFRVEDEIAQKINAILLTTAKDIPAWMCAPIFRDGIVYYDKSHSVIACLNICFNCEYMMLNEYTYVNADATVYTLLKELFISLGHEVNNDVTS